MGELSGENAPLVDSLVEHAWNHYTGRCSCGWYVPNGLRGKAIDIAHAEHQAAAIEQIVRWRVEREQPAKPCDTYGGSATCLTVGSIAPCDQCCRLTPPRNLISRSGSQGGA